MGTPLARALSAFAVAACLSPSLAAAGLLQGPRQNPLTTVTGLRCSFSLKTSALWKGGQPEIRQEPATLRVTITDVDLQDGTAEVTGPRGRRFATTILSDGSLYFMESTTGSLDVTTVFAVETSPGKLKAVRAEYSYVFLTVPPFDPNPTVTQSYGDCEPTPGA